MVAETGAPKREIELLLADLPSEAAQADRTATASAVADAEQMVRFRQPWISADHTRNVLLDTLLWPLGAVPPQQSGDGDNALHWWLCCCMMAHYK